MKKYKHLLFLSYFLIYMPWFNYVERTVTSNFHEIHVWLDDYIPFCEYFIIPYLLWFGYVAWFVAYYALHNVKDFYRLCTFLYTGMTIFLIISTVYPNGHHLRPIYFTHHNFCTMLCERLYRSDTATNLFPSIHVFNSMAVHFSVMNSKEFRKKRNVRFISGVLCISIVLATMFLKQHSVFDVLTGISLALLMNYIIYIKNPKWITKNAPAT